MLHGKFTFQATVFEMKMLDHLLGLDRFETKEQLERAIEAICGRRIVVVLEPAPASDTTGGIN